MSDSIQDPVLRRLVAHLKGTALLGEITVPPRKKPVKKRKYNKLARSLASLSEYQKGVFLSLLEGRSALLSIDKVAYAVSKDGDVWLVQSTVQEDHQYRVSLDYKTCTCPDSKFRAHECKHVRELRRLHGQVA